MPDAPRLPIQLPRTNRPTVVYTDTPCLAGQRSTKHRRELIQVATGDTDMASSVSGMHQANVIITPITMHVQRARPVPSSTVTLSSMHVHPSLATVDSMGGSSDVLCTGTSSQDYVGLTLARSSMYKRAKQQKTGACLKRPRTHNPLCRLCGKITQGHLKYKKKSWCEEAKKSTSLADKVFRDFQHFKHVVYGLTPAPERNG